MSSIKALAPSTITFLPDDRAGGAGVIGRQPAATQRENKKRGTFMHDGNSINDKGLQPGSELLVLDQLSLNVIPAGRTRHADW
jgi:hypothetical protein